MKQVISFTNFKLMQQTGQSHYILLILPKSLCRAGQIPYPTLYKLNHALGRRLDPYNKTFKHLLNRYPLTIDLVHKSTTIAIIVDCIKPIHNKYLSKKF